MAKIAYFLGANTPGGFYSLMDKLLDPARARAIYILKGGPGCGKSTLMRRVERHARAAGLEAEEILCSGDPASLDAVVLPSLGAAVVDGTAPHVVEAKCPGAVERYVDLSCCYDRAGLQPRRDDLLCAFAEYQGHYKRAYRCLGAAGELRQNALELLDTEAVQQKLVRRAAGIAGRELKRAGREKGRCEQRFLSAVTCQGRLTLWDTVSGQAGRVFELADSFGLGHHLLSALLSAGLAAGHDAVACPDPMAPGRLLHLIFPALSLAFVTSGQEGAWPRRAARRLRIDAMADSALYRANRPRLRFSRRVAEALMEDGMAGLAQAKEAHDRLEGLYHPFVDFERVGAIADRVAEELLS